MIYQKICKACKEPFTTKLSWQVYCTKKCKNKFKKKDNKDYKTEIRKCEYCNKEFEWSEKRKTQKYCSVDCRNKAERIRSKTREYKHNCLNCNEIIQGKENKNKKFCCNKCEEEYKLNKQKELLENELKESLENNELAIVKNILNDIVFIKISEIINKSKTNKIDTDFNYHEIDYRILGDIPSDTKRYVLERDNNECQICKNNNNLHIHHITKRANGGNHDPSNLITLCASCHRHIEVGDIELATKKCLKNALKYYNLNYENKTISFEIIHDCLIEILTKITNNKDYTSAASDICELIDRLEQ